MRHHLHKTHLALLLDAQFTIGYALLFEELVSDHNGAREFTTDPKKKILSDASDERAISMVGFHIRAPDSDSSNRLLRLEHQCERT